jgi:choline monooxygenase
MAGVDDVGVGNGAVFVTDEVMAGFERAIDAARGLPNRAFTDRAFFEAERRTVFARSWIFARPASDVPEAGDVLPVEVAGRPLFLARGDDGAVRVFHNVCPHRGSRLVTEPGNIKRVLTCPYHAWSFDLTGRLRARPHFNGPERHEAEGQVGADRPCLFETRSAQWHDWVFVNLDGKAPPLSDYLASALEHFDGYDLGSFRPAFHAAYGFACNWKLTVENYCDFYHVFKVHPALSAMMAKDTRRAMTPAGAHLLNGYTFAVTGRGIVGDKSGAGLPLIPRLGDNLARSTRYAVLFPNMAVNVYPTNAQAVLFEPVAPDRTVMHMWFYYVGEAATDPAFAEPRDKLHSEWAALNGEDEGICQRLQEGRMSEAYDGGRLAPYWDVGTVHFHKQIGLAMRGEGDFARGA